MPSEFPGMEPDWAGPAPPALPVAQDRICWLIVKARQFEAKDVRTGLQDASNAGEETDRQSTVLEDSPDDPVEAELTRFIEALNEDEQVGLVAMAWLGRGDGGLEDWDSLLAQAADERSGHTAAYLLGMPLLAAYLENALEQFGGSCADLELEHL